ncbi:MAG: 4Fe-4S binding protein [Nitrososphaerales archaeon]
MGVEESRIGVYLCHCGGNIGNTIDIKRVINEVIKFPHVIVAEEATYFCSKAGQEIIKESIKKNNLNRVVIAACTPLMHLKTFRELLTSIGLNPYLLEIVNLREQCSWVHEDKEGATMKAIDLIKAGVARASFLEPLKPQKESIERDVMVIGGGVAGIFASLELANKGYKVYLVEKEPSIGGKMILLNKTFPTLDCSSCILSPRMVEVAENDNINIISMAEPIKVEGTPGNYEVTLRIKPRYVDIEKCTACGECAIRCPSKVLNEYEGGLSYRKAIFQPFPQAIPSAYTIDATHCLYFQKGICKVCEKFCPRGAIKFDDKEELVKIKVGAIILATGFSLLDPRTIPSLNSYLHYGEHPDIITHFQFERLFLKGIVKPSDGKIPKKVAFILCVGSRDPNQGKPYCSKICCMIALKQAFLLKEMVPGSEPWIFYMDLRAAGKWYEEFYTRAMEHGIITVRGKVIQLTPTKEGIVVKSEDTLLNALIEETFDLVVLNVAIIPNEDLNELSKLFGIQTGPDGFLMEKHYKLEPVDGPKPGLYLCGCVTGPKDVRESVVEAMSAASRVASFLKEGIIEVSPEKAYLNIEMCDGCGLCVEACPVKAIEMKEGKAWINTLACIGCGICLPVCPRNAIDLKNHTEQQFLNEIIAASNGLISPKIIAFVEGSTAYKAMDMYGLDRRKYSHYIHTIKVPSVGRVGIKHILHAFAHGADGIALIEGEDSPFKERFRSYTAEIQKKCREYGIEAMRFINISITLPQYYKLEGLDTFAKRIQRMGPLKREIREKLDKILKAN